MGIDITDPVDIGDYDNYCFPAGRVPKRLLLQLSAIVPGQAWNVFDSPAPNGEHVLSQISTNTWTLLTIDFKYIIILSPTASSVNVIYQPPGSPSILAFRSHRSELCVMSFDSDLPATTKYHLGHAMITVSPPDFDGLSLSEVNDLVGAQGESGSLAGVPYGVQGRPVFRYVRNRDNTNVKIVMED